MSETEKIAIEAFDLLPVLVETLTARMEISGMGEDARRLMVLLLDLQEWAIQAAYESVNPGRGKELLSKARELLASV